MLRNRKAGACLQFSQAEIVRENGHQKYFHMYPRKPKLLSFTRLLRWRALLPAWALDLLTSTSGENWALPTGRSSILSAALSLGDTWAKTPGPVGGGRHPYTCQISDLAGHLPARKDNSCSARFGLRTKKREAQKGGQREGRQRRLLLDREHLLNSRESTCMNSSALFWQGISTATCGMVTRCHIAIHHINPSDGREGPCATDLNLWASLTCFPSISYVCLQGAQLIKPLTEGSEPVVQTPRGQTGVKNWELGYCGQHE